MTPEGVSLILTFAFCLCAVVGFLTIVDTAARAALDLWKWWTERRAR